jgi:hypothetical protein
MAIRNNAAMAALTVVVALLAVQYFILPVHAWTAVVVVSMLAVALSAGALIYMPTAFVAGAKTDAGRIARIGPLALTTGLTLLFSLAALGSTFTGFNGLSWALLVLAAASFIIGLVTAKAVREVADNVQITQAKDDRYRQWSGALEDVARSVSDAALKSQCGALAEDLRYAPSARAQDASSEAMLVSKAISALRDSVREGDQQDMAAKLDEVRFQLSRHSEALVAQRSHA